MKTSTSNQRPAALRALFVAMATLFGLLSMVGAASAQNKASDWVAEDAKGNKVKTADFRGKATMIFINHPEQRDAMKPITKELALKYGHNPAVSLVTIVDLRDLEFYKRPFANDKIAQAQDRTVKRIQQILKENNKPPIPGLARKLYMVPDFDGKIIDRYNHWDTKKNVTIVLLNKQGDIVGSWKDTQLDKVFEAVEATLAQ